MRNGEYQSAQRGFDEGRFLNRNIWDRRYPVVDEERGIVLSIVRFGIKGGATSQSTVTANDRLVAEFFAVKRGYIQEIQAVLFNLPGRAADGLAARHRARAPARRTERRSGPSATVPPAEHSRRQEQHGAQEREHARRT